MTSTDRCPIHTFIVKIASRCNINCSYCFIYNQSDSRWKRQPKTMKNGTATQVARRILEHCEAHTKSKVSIVFHGGEPLLGGIKHLEGIVNAFREVLDGTALECSYGMQSNGLLLSEEIVDFLRHHRITVGVSCDGPPETNDVYRIDHAGNGTGERLHENLRMLEAIGDDVFTGFLCVVNLQSSPGKVFDYLSSFNPKRIDFLLPYDNHSRYPPGKSSFSSAEYGEWMSDLFDHWYEGNSTIPVRWFASLMQLMLGGRSLVESVGLDPVDLIVVETNGEIEGVDSLKAASDGATWLGFNVFENSFDEVLEHVEVVARQIGIDSLCTTCRECDYVKVCGGGYVPNRFSDENGFDNPSVYCSDMVHLIDHIGSKLTETINAATGTR